MAFDVERYLAASKKLDTSDLDWELVPHHPLNASELAFLRYAMNIEDHTLFYLKDLLSTPAAAEPDVAAFLSCWVYEEHFHGKALEQFVAAAGHDGRRDAEARLARSGPVARAVKAAGTWVAHRMSPDFAAVHMTWGAVNELTTLTGYEQMMRKTQHPVLKELLGRIVKDERRHFAFYYNQARQRLEASPKQQRITRWLMEKAWRPVGTGEHDVDDIVHSSRYLFGDTEGQEAMRSVDEAIGRLPGMAGWTGLQRAIDARPGARKAQPLAHNTYTS